MSCHDQPAHLFYLFSFKETSLRRIFTPRGKILRVEELALKERARVFWMNTAVLLKIL